MNMSRKSREYGLMIGITIGFAVWGSVLSSGLQHQPQLAAEVVQSENVMQEHLSLHAGSAVLMDGDSGRILYKKEADLVRPMASTTKIMTCILALENGNLSDICTVSSNAASQPKVHLGAPKGTQIVLEDLLYSLMLESHNDSAVVIAEQIAGSTEAFAELMNQKARDLGCRDTYFITPNGLDKTLTMKDGSAVKHSTTAAELAKIMRYCLHESPAKDEFLRITQAPSHTFSDISGKRVYSCINHNALLTMMDGAVSGKTGFTGGAGYSYVGEVEDDGRIFIVALLGCGWPPHKTYKWEDVRTLLRYGKENFFYQELKKTVTLEPLPVEGGKAGKYGDAVELVLGNETTEPTGSYLLSPAEQVQIEVDLPQKLKAPVEKGELVGMVRYLISGNVINLEPIYANETIKKADFKDWITIFFKNLKNVKKIA